MAEAAGNDQDNDLAGGSFSEWLRGMQGALRGERDAEVPCGGCTACCASSQFVHIGPDETDALSHIPPELLFPAPRMPGHVILGYDERGRCPMLVDDGCSIYAHRPRTCRTYDCRVFPAAGVALDDDKPLIAERARRWRFDYPTEIDHNEHAAVRAAANAAARFAQEHADDIAEDSLPRTPTQLAVLAVKNYADYL
jgi:Fe-S-cluster containining protein